jgi:hypothetical protein
MALVIDDRVRETTTVTGTNDATLLGAVTGFQAFSVIGNGNTTYYTISDQSGGNWEVGIGTYSSVGPTLARTTVLTSSNSGSKVSFPAGTKDVFVTYPSDKAVYLDASNNVQPALGDVNATTVDTTNLEVTNLKAKDGTAAGSIANSTGVVTLASSVLTTTDINGGTIDGTVIGGSTAAAGTFTQVDITAQGDLRLQDTTGGQYVALQAPGTIATSYTLTLPVDDGTTGQVLTTDGSGVLSWTTDAGGDVDGPASATDNAIARFDGTTGKIIQNSAVTIADTTGDITTAGYLITAAGAVGTPALTTTGDTNTGIFFPAADTIAFTEGGVESMRIDSSGNVGIGVTPSAWGSGYKALQLSSSIIYNNNANDTFIGANYYYDGTNNKYINTDLATAYGQVDGAHIWYNAASGTAGNTVSFSERMRIDSAGNVGIGYDTPGTFSRFVVQDSGGGSGTITALSSTASNAIYIKNTGTEARFSYNDAYPMTFGTGGSERMRIDSAGLVGIGTSSPVTKLQINDTSEVAISISTSGTREGAFYSDGSLTVVNAYQGNPLIFSVASSGTSYSEKMRIDSSGNVGIGVTPAAGSKLEIVSAADNKVRIKTTTGGNTAGIDIMGNNATVDSNNVILYQGGSSECYLYNRASSFIAFGTSNTEKMRITAAGSLKINSTSAGGRFIGISDGATDGTDYGTIQVTKPTDHDGTYAYVVVQAGTQIAGMGFADNVADTFTVGNGGDANLGSGGAKHGYVGATIVSYISGTERMRIDSSGNFLVNTTTATHGGITSKCILKSANDVLGVVTDSGNTQAVRFTNGTTAVGSINLTASATSYATSSDYRLKDNVAPITDALAKVTQLKPVTYKWKVDGSDGQGFIAHELQEVVPECVTGEKDGEQMQGVDYGKITPLLTAALQEALAKIESLEARLAVLESK